MTPHDKRVAVIAGSCALVALGILLSPPIMIITRDSGFPITLVWTIGILLIAVVMINSTLPGPVPSEEPVTKTLDKTHNTWNTMMFAGMIIACNIGAVLAVERGHFIAVIGWVVLAVIIALSRLSKRGPSPADEEPI